MICILLSHERSGSHLVGEFLANLKGVRMFDEVCNADAAAHSDFSFHRFQMDYAQKDTNAFLVQRYPDRIEFIHQYYNKLATLTHMPIIATDIKYGHLHNFNSFWCPPLNRPLLMTWMEQTGAKLVHLRRKNPVDAVVSAAVASKRQIWNSSLAGEKVPIKEKFLVDTAETTYQANLLHRQSTLISEEWIGNIACFNLFYEDFVSSMSSDRTILKDLSSFVDAPFNAGWEPTLKKLGRPLKELVENYEDLRDACIAAGMDQFV